MAPGDTWDKRCTPRRVFGVPCRGGWASACTRVRWIPRKKMGGCCWKKGGRGKLPATPPILLWPGVPEPPTYEQLPRPPNALALAGSGRRPF